MTNMSTNKTQKNETTLIEALAAAQAEMKNAAFDTSVRYGNTEFKFASLSSLRDAVVPVLAKHGIAVTQSGIQLESGAWVIRTTLHKGGETIVGDTPIIANDNKAQGFGSGMTYAKRYGLAAIVCLASEQDDDGAEAQKSPPGDQKITANQVTEISAEIDRLGADRQKFLSHFKITDIKQLSAMQYLTAMNMLEQRERREVEEAAHG